MGVQAEAVGLNVMSELHDQRDSLKRTKALQKSRDLVEHSAFEFAIQGHVGDVDGHLGTSKMFLTLKSRRVQSNQDCLFERCYALII